MNYSRLLSIGLALAACIRLTAQPVLEVERLPDNQLLLGWTDATGRFQLERSAELASPNGWVPVSAAPSLAGDKRTVQVAAGSELAFFRLREASPAVVGVVDTSPAPGETGVATTRETIFRFAAPVTVTAPLGTSVMHAALGERRLLTRAELASDGLALTVFYLENLPGSSRVRVTIEGDLLADGLGRAVDADGDGLPGGRGQIEFTTAPNGGVPGTGVIGWVYAAEPGEGGTNVPLSGVTVTVDGAEETLRATTDATGFFRLHPAPVGRFFVHVDGRTADRSQWPSGAYYPFVGKAWSAQSGRSNNLAGGSGTIFLPRLAAAALTPVSATAATRVGLPASVLATNPVFAGVALDVPAGSLFSDAGVRGGRVGLAPVPPDRLPEPLPPGLGLPLVITVQTDGAMNFDRPAPVRFPNLPDPVTGVAAPPGATTALWSFNHDTGRWESQGTATISADGQFAVSDPGGGIRQPGWHGISPSSSGNGPSPVSDPSSGGGPQLSDAPDEPDNEECPNGDPCANASGDYYGKKEDWQITSQALGPDHPSTQIIFAAMQEALLQFETCLAANPDCGGVGGASAPAQRSAPRRRGTVARANTSAEAFYDGLIALTGDLSVRLSAGGRIAGPGTFYRLRPVPPAPGDLPLRGQLDAAGRFENQLLRPNQRYEVTYYDGPTRRYGAAWFRTGGPGASVQIPNAALLGATRLTSVDADGDGLSLAVEAVLGSRTDQRDSDGDGLDDGTEAATGVNPVADIALNPGLVASLPTGGNSVDVALAGEVAVLADGDAGVTFVDVRTPAAPVRLAQFREVALVSAVAAEGPMAVAVASSGGTNLFRYDLTNPRQPRRLDAIALPGLPRCVRVIGGRVLVGDAAGNVHLLRAEDGVLVQTLALGGRVDDFWPALPFVQVVVAGSPTRVVTLRLDDESLTLMSTRDVTLTLSPRRLRLHGDGPRRFLTYLRGYVELNAADPANVLLVRTNENNEFGWKHFVAAGRTALAAADPNSTPDGTHDVRLYDLPEAGVATFQAALGTPGFAAALALRGPFALVADGVSGLGVLRHLPPRADSNAPVVAFTALPFQASPPGQIAGEPLAVQAEADDDTGVDRVEFHVDGRPAGTVRGAPFTLVLPTPSRPGNFTVRARAFDVAGNAAWSAPQNFVLLPDSRPPRVRAVSPAPGARFASTEPPAAVTVEFSEPMTRPSLAAGFRLLGSDNSPVGALLSGTAESFALMPTNPLPAGTYTADLPETLTDLAGNPIAPTNWSFVLRPPATLRLPATAGADLTQAATWADGLPGSGDFVRVGGAGAGPVTLGGGLGAWDARLDQPLTITSVGTLNVLTRAEFLGLVRVNDNAGYTFRAPFQIFRGGLERLGPAQLGLSGRTIVDSPGFVSRLGGGAVGVSGINSEAGSFEIELGSVVELDVAAGGEQAITGFNSSRFENRGTLRKLGAGTTRLATVFRNVGVVEVLGGRLEAGERELGSDLLVNRGRVHIADGATWDNRGGGFVGVMHHRLAAFTGTGTNLHTGVARYENDYDFGGVTALRPNGLATFAGSVRSAGRWELFGSRVVFERGLAEITGPFLADSEFSSPRLDVEANAVVTLHNLAAQRLEASSSGRLRVLSALTVNSNSLLRFNTGRDGVMRFEGDLTLADDGNTLGERFRLSTANSAGSRIEFAGHTRWLRGRWTASGGVATNPGVVISPTGVFEVTATNTTPEPVTLRNQGTFRKLGPGFVALQWLRNFGLVEVAAGTLRVANVDAALAGQLTGELRILAGATYAPGGNDSAPILGGAVTGDGTVQGGLSLRGGRLAPGLGGPGVLTVTRTVRLDPGATLVIELGGTEPGTGHDQVVADRFEARGDLEVVLTGGFQPQIGQEFRFVSQPRLREPEFAATRGLELGGGRRLVLVSDAQGLLLRCVAAP